MTDRQDLNAIVDGIKDQAFQEIIDQMEGIQGIEESRLPGDAPAKEEAVRWTTALDKLERREKHNRPQSKRLFRIAMIAALLLSLLLVSANAKHILNWIETTYAKCTKLQLESTLTSEVNMWSNALLPVHVPDQYVIADAVNGDDVKIIEYADTEGHRIMFYQYGAASNILIDTEKADSIITSAISGATAYLFQKGELSTLYWNTKSSIFSFEFSNTCVSTDQIIQMAESLKQNETRGSKP